MMEKTHDLKLDERRVDDVNEPMPVNVDDKVSC